MTSKTTFLAFLCALLALTATAVKRVPNTPFPVVKPLVSCATIFCPEGTRCVETREFGATCVSILPPPCLCPRLFNPVCCKTPNGLKTTTNSCLCKCGSNNKVISPRPCITCANVRCKKGYRCIETPTGPRCVLDKPCICTFEFNPVCCKLASGVLVTKNNPCQCTTCNPGAKIFSQGSCRIAPLPSCICPDIFQPVCCLVKGRKFTASNACRCTCLKGSVVSKGKCGQL